jgi:hypothetical protein
MSMSTTSMVLLENSKLLKDLGFLLLQKPFQK